MQIVRRLEWKIRTHDAAMCHLAYFVVFKAFCTSGLGAIRYLVLTLCYVTCSVGSSGSGGSRFCAVIMYIFLLPLSAAFSGSCNSCVFYIIKDDTNVNMI